MTAEIAEKVGAVTPSDTLIRRLATVVDSLCRCDVPVARKLAQGVWERDLHKLVHVCRLEDFAPSKQRDQVTDLTGNAYTEVTTPSQRRLSEDMFAELIGANPGDVLLYAVAGGGNRKPAEMIVEWAGKVSPLKDITDNVIRPKIDATVHAHENLWGIYFVAAPTLGEVQVVRSKEIAEFWYTTLPQ